MRTRVESAIATAGLRVTSVSSVLAISSVRRLWIAQVLSGMGDWVAKLALGVLVFQRTGSVVALVLVYAVSLLPYAAAPIVTAALRRLPARTVLIACDVVRALVFILMATGAPTWALLVLMFIGAFPSPVFEAFRLRVLPELLPPSRTADALVLQQLTVQLVATVGLLLGGALVVLVSSTGALVLNAATFMLSALLVCALPAISSGSTDAESNGSIQQHLAVTLQTLRHTPALRIAVLITVAVSPGTMAAEAVAVAYAHTVGHPSTVGLLAAAPALAITVGGLLLSREGDDRALLTRAAQVSVVGAAAGAFLLGMPLGLSGVLVGYLAVGVPCAATPMLITVAVRNSPRELLASVVATVQAALMAASLVGAVAGGLLVASVGIQAACAIAMVTVGIVPLGVLLLPALRAAKLPVPSVPVG